MSLKDEIISILKITSELTDREITDSLRGTTSAQQPINQACRQLEIKGIISRKKKNDGLIGNYLICDINSLENKSKSSLDLDKENINNQKFNKKQLSEDEIKEILNEYLTNNGWTTKIAWGKQKGIDIDAVKNDERWVIEVKGSGSLNAMRVNYFLAILGELLQRMDDSKAKYSIALPHMQQFINLWNRLPKLAKERTKITALFIDENGNISEFV